MGAGKLEPGEFVFTNFVSIKVRTIARLKQVGGLGRGEGLNWYCTSYDVMESHS